MSAHVMNYIESDAPADLTLAEWRRSRRPARLGRRVSWIRTFVPARRRPAPAA